MDIEIRKRRKEVTLEDIAKKLNISKNAVSVALSNKPGVSEKTRQLVLQTARELGYKFKEKEIEKGTIGLIMTANVLQDPYFFSAIVYSVENEIRKKGFEFSLYCISSEKETSLDEILSNGSFKGIIIVSSVGKNVIDKIEEMRIPTVIIDNLVESSWIDTVNTDNKRSTKAAITYLISKGYKHIGFIGDINHAISYKERWQGFIEAHEQCGLEIDKEVCKIEGFKDFSKNPEPEIQEFLRGLKRVPEAFFCVSDLSTLVTANTLKDMGLQIPKDIAIVGFDDTELVKHFKPSLSMIHIDRDYYGKRAVKQLLERIDFPSKPAEDIRIFCRLNIRKSIKNI
ncbi:transcriptional regulator, LacI family [Caldicellulosiruptor hydrothermalis 108]|uniref:Transcriptional regulator, LacI family n=1 Tax=Caldicellulosiruptor hydrothermalis (strain DSM 18901 / VKM B-2411 / 108) TaxID=632292 RepID=E4Q8C7_CALH1|nr:LacI family DNA-binding transcriptional regulator [Caldicellulosiruptor hydrothermalis]ADQ07974.1 transcriptional regulator, LacI family [Caldicellulosiruptor hydrothermalis 108]